MGDGSKLFDMVAPDAGAPFALLAAAEAGDEPRVASLLRCRADVNARDERGWSPLIMAAKEGNASLLQLLLAAGAAPSAPDDASHTALRGAALFGHAECIRLLVEAGAAVNQSSERGKTPLMGAAMNGHAEALALLLRHSAVWIGPKRLVGRGWPGLAGARGRLALDKAGACSGRALGGCFPQRPRAQEGLLSR